MNTGVFAGFATVFSTVMVKTVFAVTYTQLCCQTTQLACSALQRQDSIFSCCSDTATACAACHASMTDAATHLVACSHLLHDGFSFKWSTCFANL